MNLAAGKRFLYILTVFSLVLGLFGSVALTASAQPIRGSGDATVEPTAEVVQRQPVQQDQPVQQQPVQQEQPVQEQAPVVDQTVPEQGQQQQALRTTSQNSQTATNNGNGNGNGNNNGNGGNGANNGNGNANNVVANEGNYSVGAECFYDAASNQTTCSFNAFVANGDKDISHFLYEFGGTVCEGVSVIGGTGTYTNDDPSTDLIDAGFKVESGTAFTLIFNGNVTTVDGGSYVIKAGQSAFRVGGPSLSCVTPEPTEEVTPEPTETVAAVTEVPATCPQNLDPDGDGVITDASGTQFVTGSINVATVTATFTISPDLPAGCLLRVSFASYEAPTGSFDPNRADEQVLIDSQTGDFGPGGYTQGPLDLADCFYQLDLVVGDVIVNLSAGNLYGDRKIDQKTGGQACETPTATTVVTEEPTETPTTVVTEEPTATATTQTFAPVRPVLECVALLDSGNYEARFGYLNENSTVITIPVGPDNRFSPNPQDRGQTTEFQPGRVMISFEVQFNGNNLVWTLTGPDGKTRTATASSNSKPCQDETPTPTETVPVSPTAAVTETPAPDGQIEIDKFFCVSLTETGVKFEVFPPIGEEPLFAAASVEDEDGCRSGEGVSFTVTDQGGNTTTLVTGPGGIIEQSLPAGSYTIVEDSTGASASFTIEGGKLTAIVVTNFENPIGQVKVIKFYCDGDPAQGPAFFVEGEGNAPSQNGCEPGDALFTIDGTTSFHVGDDGIRLFPLSAGSHTISEVGSGASVGFEVTEDKITTITVFNYTDQATATPTEVMTETPTETATATEVATETPTEVVTATATPTETEEATATPTETEEVTETPTDVATETPTQTATATEVMTETPTVVVTESPTAAVTETPAPEGTVELDKLVCPAEDDSIDYTVFGPFSFNARTADPPQRPESCEEGAGFSFTVTNTDDGTETTLTTNDLGIVEESLPAGNYTITEDGAEGDEGASFTVAEGQTTAIIVINNIGEEKGQVKLLKLFCEGDPADGPAFFIEGEGDVPSATGCEPGAASFTIGDEMYDVDESGALGFNLPFGTYTITEEGSEASATFEVKEGELITTIIVFNFTDQATATPTEIVTETPTEVVTETATPTETEEATETPTDVATATPTLPTGQETETPETEVPETEVPETEVPTEVATATATLPTGQETEVPETEVPTEEVSVTPTLPTGQETEVPETEVPTEEAPATATLPTGQETEVPETEVPETEVSETEVPTEVTTATQPVGAVTEVPETTTDTDEAPAPATSSNADVDSNPNTATGSVSEVPEVSGLADTGTGSQGGSIPAGQIALLLLLLSGAVAAFGGLVRQSRRHG